MSNYKLVTGPTNVLRRFSADPISRFWNSPKSNDRRLLESCLVVSPCRLITTSVEMSELTLSATSANFFTLACHLHCRSERRLLTPLLTIPMSFPLLFVLSFVDRHTEVSMATSRVIDCISCIRQASYNSDLRKRL
jgi:hypothetical protein